MSLEQFNMTTSMLDQILTAAMSQGGDFADVFCERGPYSSLVMEESILKTAGYSVGGGVGVRVVKGEKTGYAYTEVFEKEHFLKAARSAAAIADDRGSSLSYPVSLRPAPDYYPVGQVETAMEAKIEWLYLADRHARALSPHVSKVVASFAESQRSILIADTRGQMSVDFQPMVRFNVSVVVEKEGQVEDAQAGDGGRHSADFFNVEKIKLLTKQAVTESESLLTARQAPAGMLPVILAPGDSGILLHEAIGHPLEADFNRRKTSAYAGRMGDQVASEQCTIIDDGTVPHDRGSINFDDELNASQKTTLIENGRLVSYMYDEMSARFFNVPSSGNGRRESYQYQPLPRMRSTYMLNGKYDPGEIIASTERGIYCRTFKGGQVDISNGNFVFVPSDAYLVEHGKISHPIKNLTLIGNGPEVLSQVSMVGNDFKMSPGIWTCGKGQTVPVGVGLPTVKISEMTVGGASA
ncbi:MAG: metalloprotease TldD [Acidobacteria bacterium]|nr:MAG: metalloprotease TldD [Acidobacteriota bacterium]